MKVYRIEHPEDNKGPYIRRWSHPNQEFIKFSTDLCWAHDDDAHPSPRQEGLSVDYEPWQQCACKTLASLKQWFVGWFEGLHEHGYLLKVYEVPKEHVQVGAKQVVFDSRQAKLLSTKDLKEYL